MFRSIFWSAIIGYSVWSGWRLPTSPETEIFPSGEFGLFIAVFPALGFLLASFSPVRPEVLPVPWLERPFDRILGDGNYRWVAAAGRLPIWLGVVSSIMGAVGLARSIYLALGESALLVSLFFLLSGLGMLWLARASIQRYSHGRRDA